MNRIKENSKNYEELLTWLKKYEIQLKEASFIESKIFQRLPKFENNEFYKSIEDIEKEDAKWSFIRNFNNVLQETLDIHQNCSEKLTEFYSKYEK